MPSARARVYVIAADPDLRVLITDALADAGMEPCAFGDVDVAVEAARVHPPRVVVAELGTLESDASELVRRLRELGLGRTRTIAMSTRAVAPSTAQTFDVVLLKPFSLADLLGAVTGAPPR